MENGKPIVEDLAMRTAMNKLLREAYAHDCQKALDKWNKEVADFGGCNFKFALPSRRFNRTVGEFAGWRFDPSGLQLSPQLWEQKSKAWLPTVEDRSFVKSSWWP